MNEKTKQVLNKGVVEALMSSSKEGLKSSLTKLAALADIVDQSGDSKIADKIDDFIKQAGFWSNLLSGMLGAAGPKLWESLKSGNLKSSLAELIKAAVIGGGAAAIAGVLIEKLDDMPVIGSLLKEIVGAPKLQAIITGIIGKAVADSDFVEKLADQLIEAVEGLLGFGGQSTSTTPATSTTPHSSTLPPVPGQQK